jgi:hypothetical protein
LIDSTLASGVKSGYSFVATGTTSGYVVYANPTQTNTTGVRAFCSIADAVVRTNTAGITTCAGTETPLQ